MANAMEIICNKDLFLYIQSFVNGYEGIVIHFRAKFDPKPSLWNLFEEALTEKNWNVVNLIYKRNKDKLNNWSFSNRFTYVLRPIYPHHAYSLLSTCEWLHTRTDDTFSKWLEYVNTAAKVGDLNMLMYMHDHECKGFTRETMNWAARFGHLDVVKFLHANRIEGCTTQAMDWASKNGHLEVVQFLHQNRTEGCTTKAMDWASYMGHFEIVQFLHYNRDEGCTAVAINSVSGNGHLDIVKFLHKNRTEGYTEVAVDYASRRGHLDIVRYLEGQTTESSITNTTGYGFEIGICVKMRPSQLSFISLQTRID